MTDRRPLILSRRSDASPLPTSPSEEGLCLATGDDLWLHGGALGDDGDEWRAIYAALGLTPLAKSGLRASPRRAARTIEGRVDRRTVQRPGSRGGVWYYDDRGQVRYGIRPAPDAAPQDPDGETIDEGWRAVAAGDHVAFRSRTTGEWRHGRVIDAEPTPPPGQGAEGEGRTDGRVLVRWSDNGAIETVHAVGEHNPYTAMIAAAGSLFGAELPAVVRAAYRAAGGGQASDERHLPKPDHPARLRARMVERPQVGDRYIALAAGTVAGDSPSPFDATYEAVGLREGRDVTIRNRRDPGRPPLTLTWGDYRDLIGDARVRVLPPNPDPIHLAGPPLDDRHADIRNRMGLWPRPGDRYEGDDREMAEVLGAEGGVVEVRAGRRRHRYPLADFRRMMYDRNFTPQPPDLAVYHQRRETQEEAEEEARDRMARDPQPGDRFWWRSDGGAHGGGDDLHEVIGVAPDGVVHYRHAVGTSRFSNAHDRRSWSGHIGREGTIPVLGDRGTPESDDLRLRPVAGLECRVVGATALAAPGSRLRLTQVDPDGSVHLALYAEESGEDRRIPWATVPADIWRELAAPGGPVAPDGRVDPERDRARSTVEPRVGDVIRRPDGEVWEVVGEDARGDLSVSTRRDVPGGSGYYLALAEPVSRVTWGDLLRDRRTTFVGSDLVRHLSVYPATGALVGAGESAVSGRRERGHVGDQHEEREREARRLERGLSRERRAALREMFGDGVTEQHVRDAFTVEAAGISSEVHSLDVSGGHASIGGAINRDGRQIGSFEREFVRDDRGNLIVRHALMSIAEADRRGDGFALALNERAEVFYRRAGVSTVRVQANITIGKYAWAKQGFDFADDRTRAAVVDAFVAWLDRRGVAYDREELDRLRDHGRAWDLATFDTGTPVAIAEEYSVGSFHAGKAFLLSSEGNGGLAKGWYGVKSLAEGSESQRVWGAYLAERKKQGGKKPFSVAKEGPRPLPAPGVTSPSRGDAPILRDAARNIRDRPERGDHVRHGGRDWQVDSAAPAGVYVRDRQGGEDSHFYAREEWRTLIDRGEMAPQDSLADRATRARMADRPREGDRFYMRGDENRIKAVREDGRVTIERVGGGHVHLRPDEWRRLIGDRGVELPSQVAPRLTRRPGIARPLDDFTADQRRVLEKPRRADTIAIEDFGGREYVVDRVDGEGVHLSARLGMDTRRYGHEDWYRLLGNGLARVVASAETKAQRRKVAKIDPSAAAEMAARDRMLAAPREGDEFTWRGVRRRVAAVMPGGEVRFRDTAEPDGEVTAWRRVDWEMMLRDTADIRVHAPGKG